MRVRVRGLAFDLRIWATFVGLRRLHTMEPVVSSMSDAQELDMA